MKFSKILGISVVMSGCLVSVNALAKSDVVSSKASGYVSDDQAYHSEILRMNELFLPLTGGVTKLSYYQDCVEACVENDIKHIVEFDNKSRIINIENFGETAPLGRYQYTYDNNAPHANAVNFTFHSKQKNINEVTELVRDKFGNLMQDTHRITNSIESINDEHWETSRSKSGSIYLISQYKEGKLIATYANQQAKPPELSRTKGEVNIMSYGYHDNGVLYQRQRVQFYDGKEFDTFITWYDDSGDLLAYRVTRPNSELDNRYQYANYTYDEHNNWISRQKCMVGSEWNKVLMCSPEKRDLVYGAVK